MKKLRDEVIGKRIRQARAELGFTLEEVAAEVGLRPVELENIEKGNAELSIDTAALLCDFFGIEAEDLMNTDDQELDSLILFRHGSSGPSNEELLDRTDLIFVELMAQVELYNREQGEGKVDV